MSIRRNPTRLSHIIDRVLKQEQSMNQYMPPHKHVGDAGKPGQIVNPVNTDMMDDMAEHALRVHPANPCENPACVCPNVGNTESAPLAATYKPTHGGYPG